LTVRPDTADLEGSRFFRDAIEKSVPHSAWLPTTRHRSSVRVSRFSFETPGKLTTACSHAVVTGAHQAPLTASAIEQASEHAAARLSRTASPGLDLVRGPHVSSGSGRTSRDPHSRQSGARRSSEQGVLCVPPRSREVGIYWASKEDIQVATRPAVMNWRQRVPSVEVRGPIQSAGRQHIHPEGFSTN
jgi:hypothetical protein